MTHRDPQQMDLLLGLQLAESGMAQAVDHTNRLWKDVARETIYHLAGAGVRFTSEQVTAHVGLPVGQVARDRNNGVGGVVNGIAKRGIITLVGYRNSERAVSHARLLRIWKGTDLWQKAYRNRTDLGNGIWEVKWNREPIQIRQP